MGKFGWRKLKVNVEVLPNLKSLGPARVFEWKVAAENLPLWAGKSDREKVLALCEEFSAKRAMER